MSDRRGLGRIPSPPDDRDWHLQDRLQLVRPKWRDGQRAEWKMSRLPLDQGDYGTCVGNGWAQWGNCQPVADRFTERAARQIYYEATVAGGYPDDPDAPGGGQQGSTVRDGARAMLARGRLGKGYAFAGTVDHVIAWVRSQGPVVVGTDWHDGMFEPDVRGFVFPTGAVAGGHCYVCVGDTGGGLAGAGIFLNSWGPGWGINGRFLMDWSQFAKLWAAGGEGCTGVELPATRRGKGTT